MLVDRIIRSTIQTGALTSVCAIIDLILFLVNPTALHLTFNFALAKLYTNALMSSLNSRRGWRYANGPSSNSNSRGTASEDMACGTPGGNNRRSKKTPSSANKFVRVSVQRPQEVVVNVDIESYELRDADAMASRTGTDSLEIGRTEGLKATDIEYGQLGP
ncbi:hypothetical protein PM082_021269 [Marasmius tenuissimus]|nr:hypothetical protein PM082_021269 [Marasmius tenuissimus]